MIVKSQYVPSAEINEYEKILAYAHCIMIAIVRHFLHKNDKKTETND